MLFVEKYKCICYIRKKNKIKNKWDYWWKKYYLKVYLKNCV